MLVHPVAALPFHRPLGRYAVLSALVIGSMVPDMHYFLPLAISRGESHSIPGLFWFCLPVGLAFYFLFHFVLKQPLSLLLPRSIQRRLHPSIVSVRLPKVKLGAVLVSLMVGAMSHLVWDAFTHEYAAGTRAFPALHSIWITLGDYQLAGYEVLQQLSNLLGFILLSVCLSRWMRANPPQPSTQGTAKMSIGLQRLIWVSILIIACVFSVSSVQRASGITESEWLNLHIALKQATLAAMASGGLALLAYSLLWQTHAYWRRH